jgi:hypothetical protein
MLIDFLRGNVVGFAGRSIHPFNPQCLHLRRLWQIDGRLPLKRLRRS